ncbi:Exoglucanase 1 [Chaetomidium leptoderma]|uniref:Glucanase n=1 Tax=Chaetomidium leptoderma TaxID=669021 RepID=A0AAN6VFB2_9PEZI|nr:Exoglucanase 1 [Chaetomidium leptoderma]
MDANWRWLHQVGSSKNCFSGNTWEESVCNSVKNCTDTCALEGAQYAQVYGVKAANDSVSLKLFLMESKTRYEMFTLMDNELAFDIDLSTVECGINSALDFVPMDPDGGQAKYPSNKAGAECGTAYCDQLQAGPETDDFLGKGRMGACCPEFRGWDSNSHSFSMSSHTCPDDGLYICNGYSCDSYDERAISKCDRWGCSYNLYRMGNTDFYGKGKKVDTARKFTVVTQFDQDKVTQFFIQDGQKFDMPGPVWEGLPKEGGLSANMCSRQPTLDSVYYPPYDSEGLVGRESGGHCYVEDNDPAFVRNNYPNAFGPVGSTVKV